MAPNPEAHYGRGGWRCGPPGDRRRRWCDDPSNSASGFATPTVASDVLPTGASLVNANSNSNSNSLNPIAVIVPTLVGAALLILAIGGFFIWRRRRREAAAAAAASSSGSNSGTSERGGMRGGALGGVVDEKLEIPPRYEDARHDRSISVPVSPSPSENPFADPTDPEPAYEPPVSPVTEVERAVVTDGLRRQPSGVSEVSRVSGGADSRRGLIV